MKKMISIMVLAMGMILVGGLGGCSGKQARANAQAMEASANIAEQAAQRIEQTLAQFPPGSVEESQLAEAIAEMLPGDVRAQFDQTVLVAGDVRSGAGAFAEQLRAFSQENFANAQTLYNKADDQDAIGNALAIGEGWLKFALGGTTITGLFTSLFYRRKKQEAEFIGEDIVTSIKASPAIQIAIDGEGGAQLRTSMSPVTMRFVKKVKDES